MPNRKPKTNTVKQPEAVVDKPPVDTTTAKDRVQEMFGGVEQPTVTVEVPAPLVADDDDANAPSVQPIKDRIDALFDGMGTAVMPDTMYPTGRTNNGVEASEFCAAEQLKKRAEKRYNKAKAAAEAAGCFGDKDSYRAGQTVEVFRNPHYTFSVKKGDDTQMIDRERVEDLLKHLAPGKWQEYLQSCMKPRSGPTQVIVSLK